MKTFSRPTIATFLATLLNVSAATHYVSPASPDPRPPYTNWLTASTNIQQAVDVAATNDAVMVTNGVYPGGVTVANPLALVSVNGPSVTVIDGGAVDECVILTTNASLTGFTLTNGQSGVTCRLTNTFVTNCVILGNSPRGGATGATLFNCTLAGNCAKGESWIPPAPPPLPGMGGGALNCTLYNCTLVHNSATSEPLGAGGYGGAAIGCTLYNCILTDNYADQGAAAFACKLFNCILNNNGCDQGSILNCCLGADPKFMDYANGNLRLQSDSPCINAGNNDFVTTAADLGGNSRIVSGTVDIGAYEYQGTGSLISYAWLQQYGLPTDGSADSIDSDGDGLNNWQEWVCRTCPTNPFSALCLLSAVPHGTDTTVTWQSESGVNYSLERSTNLASEFTVLATNIIGQTGTTTYVGTNLAGTVPCFFRVAVTPP